MHPKQQLKRVVTDTGSSPVLAPSYDFSKASSLRNEAALLLSIADIAQSELTTCPSALSDLQDLETAHHEPRLFPKFPSLSCDSLKYDSKNTVSPQSESLRGLLYRTNTLMGSGAASSRLRSVSIEDSPTQALRRTPSPLACPPTLGSPALVTPIPKSHKLAIRCSGLSIKARHESMAAASKSNNKSPLKEPVTPTTPGKNKPLQGPIPRGVSITKVYRKKFSWKSYPELEQFLIANREEYLRHSALNYTLQQKQYNNRLTERLLELATEHGYVFDTKDFGFVTVRDRIRCYYKSFVQSAKKRGILMGYAARKAGLLDEGELEKSTGEDATIITPH